MRRFIPRPTLQRPTACALGLTLCALAVAIWPPRTSEAAAEHALALRIATPLLPPGTDATTVLLDVVAPDLPRDGDAPIALALVVDTSTSMAGNKLANARAAARETVSSMSAGDRLTLVAFDTEARVLVADAAVGEQRQAIMAAIDGLISSGSTCIACGLERAWSQLAETRAPGPRTAVLISDGAITVGVSDPETLATMAEGAAASAVRTTAIGLGRDYESAPLRAIAGGGLGAFYFAHNSKLLAHYARHELDLTRRAALTDVRLTVRPSGGLHLAPPAMRSARFAADGALRLDLGRMAPGERRRVLIPARLMPGVQGARIEARLDATRAGDRQVVFEGAAGLERTADRRLAQQRRDPGVGVEQASRRAADTLEQAFAELSREEVAAAERRLTAAIAEMKALREATGTTELDEPLAAARAVLGDVDAYLPGSDALITARRANAGVQFERTRGMVDDLNSVYRGSGLFDARELE